MLITNNETDPVQVSLSSRQLRLEPGEETFITPDEVRAPTLRDALQERSIAIVRPATPDEDKARRERFDGFCPRRAWPDGRWRWTAPVARPGAWGLALRPA